MRSIFCFLLALIPFTAFGTEPDLTYLLHAKPEKVTLTELKTHAEAVEENYQKYHQVDGIMWQGIFSKLELEHPDQYGSGGDSLLFTGFYLAAAVHRYRVTRNTKDFQIILETLRGLHILSHISGIPGVLARCAFPSDKKEKWNYPAVWQGRIDEGYVYTSSEDIKDVLNPSQSYPQMIFYARVTRDQLTGFLFGLAVAWKELSQERLKPTDKNEQAVVVKARGIVAEITHAVWNRLRSQDFKILDHQGKSGTTAYDMSGLQKLQLLALYKNVVRETADERRAKRINEKYKEEFNSKFFWNGGDLEDLFNSFNNYDQYYAFNLRFTRAYTAWLLEENPKRRKIISEYIRDKLWYYTKVHYNAFFGLIRNITREPKEPLDTIDDTVWGLKSLSLRPLRSWDSPLHDQNFWPSLFVLLFGDQRPYVVAPHLRDFNLYFAWQDDPFSTGQAIPGASGFAESTGVDFLLPYWMAYDRGYFAEK